MKETQIQQKNWNNLWSGIENSLGPLRVVHCMESQTIQRGQLNWEGEKTEKDSNVQNNVSNEIPESRKTSFCRGSAGLQSKQAIGATFSLPPPRVQLIWIIRWSGRGPNGIFLSHKLWACTGVHHVGSIPAKLFILILILINMSSETCIV